MRKILIVGFFFILQISLAQEKGEVSIDWVNGKYAISENYEVTIPYSKTDCFRYDEVSKSVFYSKKFLVTAFIDETSLKIFNVNYEIVSEDKLLDLDKKMIPTSINASIQNAIARDINYGVLSFSPIIKEGAIYKRVNSFSYTFSSGKANNEASRAPNVISSSVLKTGVWHKFYVQKSGVYVLTKAYLAQLGFNVNVDPRTIKIYGNGGRMMPLLNAVPYPSDLAENAVYFKGENDGVFDAADYILFYAEATADNWNQESQTHINLYSDKAYYYITSSASNGKRMAPIAESTQAVTNTFTTFDDYQFTEIDKTNIGRLGRKWFGQAFNVNNDQNFDFNFPNIVTSSPVSVKVQVAAAAVSSTSFAVKANNQNIGNIGLSPISFSIYGYESSLNASFSTTSGAISINLNYNNNGVPSSAGYLDYIILKAKSFLKGYGKQFRFKVDAVASTIGTAEYQISNAASISQVWDITDIYNVRNKENNGQAQISLKTTMGSASNYVVVDNNDLFTPSNDANSSVSNQDVKGSIFLNNQNVFQDIDYVIVTASAFVSQAERLANFHRDYSKLNVKVVTLESLYEEFGSGKQDIGAIRNFVKYVYDNASSPAKRLKYLCLFGDASFDLKNRTANNSNVCPIFHSLNSFSGSSSFISDDFFGLMDANEGYMDDFIYRGLDVAVGRILFSDLTQAEQMISKVIDYHNQKSLGRWRNNVVMISDDIDKSSDSTIQTDVNTLADTVIAQKPFLNVKKIHSDSYVQETTSGGQKYPKVKEDFVNAIDQGALVSDYFGHGGEDGLAAERIFEKTDAMALTNKYKYTLFITVTCEFTRFDNPFRVAAGELVFTNPAGGAVSMITTTREIGQVTGSIFNQNLMGKLFSYGSNQYVSIAEAVRLTKNQSNSSGNNVVFYLGDPALQLAIPKPKIKLTKINGVPIASVIDPLKALSFATLSGEVTDEFDVPLSNYNGDVAVNIFDKDISRITLGNDGAIKNGVLDLMPFITSGETIFRGNASIVNGQFEFGFVVPRDIRIPVGNGKVSFYATKNGTTEDKTGYDFNIKIGGIDLTAAPDTTPPKVRLYMNDEAFVSGGITNQSPLFLAFLEDEHGINTASGIGHDILAYLDGDETKPYILNDFYETELNDYTKGKLKFPFRNLALGLHTLTFKAWDVYNNLISSELQFIVVGDETLTLSNVLNYPNPFVNHTEFWFTHNRPFEPLEVQVQVFTIAGKVVWSKNETVVTDGFLSRSITWDGRDDFGDKIGKGVYVYKLTVKSTITNKKTEKFEKLVIL
jgi:Peptidase family C25